MAVTINSGLVGTADPLSNDLAVSMDTKVAVLDSDASQFSTMLMKLPVSQARSFKEEWLEDVYLPKNTALAATAASADTVLTITTNEGSYAKANDVGKFVQTGEAFRITGVSASSWTVVRAIGSVSAATAASGTTLGGIVIVNGAAGQGDTLPTAIVTQKTTAFNYCQIVRNSYEFTNTAQWVTWYSGNPLAYHRLKIATEHKREIENGLFWGSRSYTGAGGANSKPMPTFGGLDHYISTNITDIAGTFTRANLQDFLRSGLEYGDPNRKVMFVAPIVAQAMSEFLQNNWVRAQPDETVFGVKVDAVISAVQGAKIPVFVKNDWKRYGEGTGKHLGSRAYLVDMTNVELRKAPPVKAGPRYLSLYSNRQANDADFIAEEYLSEVTFVPKVEKAHALLRGITGSA